MNLHVREDFLTYVGVFLLVLLLITMALGAWIGINPMAGIHWNLRDAGFVAGAAIVMMAFFGLVTPARQQAEEILGPSLAACRWYDLIPMAALVGMIEELLFRGLLERWTAGIVSPWAALLLVNLFFGALHAVSAIYFVVATLLGCLLSWLAAGVGEFNLLRPIVAHAVYDYIGFVWIAATYRRSHDPNRNSPEEPSAQELDNGD